MEKFAEVKGKRIAEAIFSKYGEGSVVEQKSFLVSFWDGLLNGAASRMKVENEIYERALHEATAFFLKNTEAKFDDKIVEALRFRLLSRIAEPKKIEKSTPEEMLANLIKIEALDFLLLERNVIV
ncbi:MAG: hypothetical protein ABSC19_14675 [Syntrophorhabdales bacterium]|jgi:hypothetical protein